MIGDLANKVEKEEEATEIAGSPLSSIKEVSPYATSLSVSVSVADDGSPEAALDRGDHREALARCAKEHAAGIGRLCMALTGSQAEADELVQEVLILAHDSFPSYRAEGTLRSWLFGIARRVCARHLETRQRHARLRLIHTTGRTPETRAPLADEIIMQREEAERARSALAMLKPTEREALLLRYGSDLAFREVAAACGIDEPTARKRVSRAIVRLRETLTMTSTTTTTTTPADTSRATTEHERRQHDVD